MDDSCIGGQPADRYDYVYKLHSDKTWRTGRGIEFQTESTGY
jgi:hypothetical protein